MKPLFAIIAALLATLPAHATDLSGVVLNADNKPIPAAHVFVYTAHPKNGDISSVCPSCYRDCGKQQVVGTDGAFRLRDVDHTLAFDLLAVADGYESTFVTKLDPAAGPVKIALRRRSPADANRLITGVVLGPENKPVVGATVQPNGYHYPNHGGVGYGDLPGVEKRAITNEKGEFALTIPDRDGILDVRVTSRSLAPHIERKLLPGERRVVHLADGATMTGHVLHDGKPVKNALVVVSQRGVPSGDYLGRSEIGTNDDGLFVLTNLGPNEIYVVKVDNADPKVVPVGDTHSAADAGTLVVK